MKSFWSENQFLSPVKWLVKAIHMNLDFSFSVKKIPSPDFIKNFRIKYEKEFKRLEGLEAMNVPWRLEAI